LIPPLYAIIDEEAAQRRGWTPLALATAFLAGGATFLQLRMKRASGASFLGEARAIVERAHAAGARVVINDRADIARLAGADGVHLGQDDLAPAAVRRIVGDQAIVGVSTHTQDQVATAVTQPISYLAIGPIFGTSTKSTGYEPVGLDAVRCAAGHAREKAIPVVAIGGITLERAASVLEAGAASVAIIGDLVVADPAFRVREYVDRLSTAGQRRV
jgi:thiamine-phosphate pyrophosphorylase